MKIAYNSAYVQIETFNFTFAQQAFIVSFKCAKKQATIYRHIGYNGMPQIHSQNCPFPFNNPPI